MGTNSSKSQKKSSTNGNKNNFRHEDNITSIDDSDRTYSTLQPQQSSQYREQTNSMYSSSTEPPVRRRKTQQSIYTFEQLKQNQPIPSDSNRPPPLPPQELLTPSPSLRKQPNVDDNTASLTYTPKEYPVRFGPKIPKPHYPSQSSKPSCPSDYNKLPKSDSSSEEYKFSTTTKQDEKGGSNYEEEDNRLECMICLEKRNKKGFLQITNTCSHEKIICRNCIRSHIGTRLDEKGDINITCPVTGCAQLLTYDNVKRLVRKEMFERFDLLTVRQELNSMPDFRWCKNPSCGSGQIHANREYAPIVTCQICKARSCYVHDIPWHENMSCDEYDKLRKNEEAATLDYLTRETKPCPKCGVRISKNGGCNHMTCKVSSCKYEFCWLCMADFDEIRKHGNDRHQPSCQLYA
ncbi:20858_t:CDS:2 [Entrophospora sp. SA101]|nr:10875_t:CDS:2 [Entrophospora sp. SA101]CAJ0757279.1 20858_t:CDS:2 [Entrophospora sp. SA101]CAJ0838036.1 13859_t:CDS:2 [Entrophospora sp. SA101]